MLAQGQAEVASLPSEWASSALSTLVVDAVLFTTEALFENETAAKGKIVHISRLAARGSQKSRLQARAGLSR
jgi:hypothetical protein